MIKILFSNRRIKRNISKPDILLVLCPPWDVSMPPLGIAYLSSYLKKYNIKSSIFDINITLYHDVNDAYRTFWKPEMYEWWFDEQKFSRIIEICQNYFDIYVKEILSNNAPVVGFSVHAANHLFTLEIVKRIKAKNKDIVIILGGPACFGIHLNTFFPLDKVKNIVDIFVIGEGEETLTELVLNLKNKKNGTVFGAMFTDNLVSNNYLPREPIKYLDKIPFPTFEEFFLGKYLSSSLPLLLSRGCISQCSFCNDYRMSAPYRWRSPSYVVEEIKYHLNHNHSRNFSFKDLLCNGNKRVLEEFCGLLIKEKLYIHWDTQAISRRDMDENLLKKMKEAGCVTLIYGVESCSNKILTKMRKLFTKENVKKVLADTHRAGIKTYVNIIVGFPSETEEDFLETYNFIRENRDNIDCVGALSTCLVNAETNLNSSPQDYGLILSEDSKRRARYWEDIYGSNYELRRQRAERLLVLLRKLGISHDSINI